jgi:hypothetical protein
MTPRIRSCSAGFFLMATCFSFSVLGAGSKGIANSVHDFSADEWNIRAGVCSPCHQAHNTAATQPIPLWSHASSTANFVPYDSPTFNAGARSPSGSSLACLSCHDGTVAVNQLLSGIQGFDPFYAGHRIGPNLHVEHLVSFVYDVALASQDGGLENPLVYRIGDAEAALTMSTPPVPTAWDGVNLTGKTIDESLLINHKVECSSCHDVHKLAGSAPANRQVLRILGNDATGRRDLLCRNCHVK